MLWGILVTGWNFVLFRVHDTISFMEVRTITEAVQFSSEKMQKVNLFESPRMFCDIYCPGTWADAEDPQP